MRCPTTRHSRRRTPSPGSAIAATGLALGLLAGVIATADARCTAYLPPKTGITVAYYTRGTEQVTGGDPEKVALSRHAVIERAPGDDVVLRYRDPRAERRDDDEETYLVTYFRGIWPYASSFGGRVRVGRTFDRAKLADLWPLLPGKKVTVVATDTQPAAVGKPPVVIGRTEVTVEVEGEETVRLQAGRFSTCVLLMRVRTWRLHQDPNSSESFTRLAVTEESKVWLAPRIGLPVKTETVIRSHGIKPGSGVRSEERSTTTAVWVRGN